MTWRLFIFSILLGMGCFLVWNNYQATGSLSKSFNKSWRDVTTSDVVVEAKKAWNKSNRQAQTTMKKIKDGRLAQDAVKFVDKLSLAMFGVKTQDLQSALQSYDKIFLDVVLFVVWVVLGYFCYCYFSSGLALFSMAISLFAHALFGPAWCMYDLIVLVGLLCFLFSVIANNAVFTAFVLSGCYVVYAFWRLVGPSEANRMDRVEARISLLQEELNHIGQQLSVVDNKLDHLKTSRNNAIS